MTNEIDYGWKGSVCTPLLSGIYSKDFLKYFNFLNQKNINDPKGRLHYAIKSFVVCYGLSKTNHKSAFHIGFGANGRYPASYEYFGIKFNGCELPTGQFESWYKPHEKSSYNIIQKDFLTWEEKDFVHINCDYENLVVVSEATFYYFLKPTNEFIGRHIFVDVSEEELVQRFNHVLNLFVKRGIKSFLFFEPDHFIFEKFAKENNLEYRKIEMNENFKYDFLLDYNRFRIDPQYFPKIHVIETNENISKVFEQLVNV